MWMNAKLIMVAAVIPVPILMDLSCARVGMGLSWTEIGELAEVLKAFLSICFTLLYFATQKTQSNWWRQIQIIENNFNVSYIIILQEVTKRVIILWLSIDTLKINRFIRFLFRCFRLWRQTVRLVLAPMHAVRSVMWLPPRSRAP